MRVAKSNLKEIPLLPNMSNRHGLISGATGTGKTVTLQKIVESFSNIGVPTFVADVKGDLSGIAMAAVPSDKLNERLAKIGVTDWTPCQNPVQLWDIFGDSGHPIRTTISDMGPLLLSRLLDLNEVQSGLLQMIFKIADDNELLLLDMKDLRSMVQFVADNASEFKTSYGSISSASAGAIQRGLLALEQEGADKFFGEPMLDIFDLIKTDSAGRGIVNILAANKLYSMPKLYAMSLLWLLSELYENLPEVGDLDKPKMVFFFDEAHLLFNDTPAVLMDKIEMVVRLIRSKGVGVFFVTQNPSDVPDSVLGQLGNRVQHALRAFTPKDLKSVKAAAQSMRANPELDTEKAIQELGTGEALVSFLDEKGSPAVVELCSVIAPGSRLGAVTDAERKDLIKKSTIYGKYEKSVDRKSAYESIEKLRKEIEKKKEKEKPAAKKQSSRKEADSGLIDGISKLMRNPLAKEIGGKLVRGILGSLTKR
ncbi:MAG: DUF853 domain-containing protein [Deferribacteraceae bacterium]|jgi:DNA helicase HerA-like ATPase|nr:DUF853 domain-containing protein [Deferribacteraceae bacterium]